MKRPLIILIPITVIIAAFLWRRGGSERFTPLPSPLPVTQPAEQAQLNAVIADARGSWTITRGGQPLEGAHVGQTLQFGDVIATNKDGYVSVEFFSGSRVALDANTTLHINEAMIDRRNWKNQNVRLSIESGRIWSRVLPLFDENARFQIETKDYIASAQGGAFLTTAVAAKDGKKIDLAFDQFDGALVFTGKTSGRLFPGFSISDHVYWTADETHNNVWIHEQLNADKNFAQAAGAVRSKLGLSENFNKIGQEAGTFIPDQPDLKHDYLSLAVSSKSGALTVRPGGMLDLAAKAMFANTATSSQDVSTKATWQVSDPLMGSVDPLGTFIANPTVKGSVAVGARWSDGTHEHSGYIHIVISGKPVVEIKDPKN